MEFYSIPIDDHYILYRPLLKKAFIGNRSMLDLVQDLLDKPAGCGCQTTTPPQIRDFLDGMGFLQSDPPTPPRFGRDFHPTTAVLLLTNRCNLRCTYCYANAGVMPTEDLSQDLAYSVIDQVYKNALETHQNQFNLSFHGGGEPMQAWKVIKAATEYARSKNLPCHITMVSNGIWSNHQREWVLKNLDGLTISIDGGEATQDVQRPLATGEGSFKYVLHTLSVLDKHQFNYGIRMTATAPWRERFPEDLRQLCEATGCKTFQVEPAFNINRGEHQEAHHNEAQAFVDAFIDAHEIAQSYGRRLVYSGARLGLVTQSFCSAPYNALIVNAGGQLVTCYEIASESHALSHISTIGQVNDSGILLDTQARDYLINFLENKQDSQCQNCFARWHCAGDCYTRASFVNDDELIVSTARCYINRQITAQLLLWHIMNNDGVWNGNHMQAQMQYQPTGVSALG